MTPHLHDAVLLRIDIDWIKKQATLTFRSAEGAVSAVVHGCSLAELPRAEPWGPSKSVYEVEVHHEVHELARLSLQMQSGDCLVFEGKSVDWVT